MHRLRFTPYALILVMLYAPLARAQVGDAQVTTKFREGLTAFHEGRYDQAYLLFEEVLAGQPSNELALRLRDEAGVHVLFEMLASEHKELATVVRKILSLSEEGAKRESQSPQVIKDLLRDLKSPDFRTQYVAREELIARVGHYVIPYVVETLGDRRDKEFRVRCIDLLVAMGEDAVLPMMEVLESPDSFTRQNAAAILGHIQDGRAVPALLRVLQAPGEDSLVKAEASESLRRIAGRDPAGLGEAKQRYFDYAERYYLDDPSLVRTNYKEWVVWKWREGKLTYDVTDRHAYNDEVAEELSYDALGIDPSYQPIWTLLICVYYAELAEARAILDVARESARRGVVSNEDLRALTQAHDALQHVTALNTTVGKRHLYRALRRALDDRMVPVAVEIIDALRELKVNGDLLPTSGGDRTYGSVDDSPMAAGNESGPIAQATPPVRRRRATSGPGRTPARRPTGPTRPEQPVGPSTSAVQPLEGWALVDALSYPDKRVKYAAARCLAVIDPPQPFYSHDKVIDNLMEAVGESGPRVVLVIENDLQSRNRLAGIFKRLNYMTVEAESGFEGINRARSFPAEDLIVVSTNLDRDYPADASFSQVIDVLRNDPRTQHIPVILVTESRRQKELADIYEGRADRVVSADLEEAGYRPILDEMFDTEQAREDAKARAEEISRIAAETLAGIDPRHSIFRSVRAVPALIDALAGRSAQVKIPCIQALGVLRATEAIPALDSIFKDVRNSPREVRVAAADALGMIVEGANGAISPQTFAALQEGLNDPDRNIREASGRALGKANLSAQDMFSIFQEQRIEQRR